MTSRIKNLFKSFTGDRPEGAGAGFAEKDLAAAALLVEAAYMDGSLGTRERQAIEDILIRRLGLDKTEAEDLFQAALGAQAEATHLMRFTRTIKDHYSQEERIELIEMMWQVAYADGILHDYEDSLIRRVAGLIYVSDFERGAAKKRVLEEIENG